LTHDLSPLDRDNQRVKVSQDELGRAARLFQGESGWEVANPYSALFDHVHPLVIGAVDRASALSTRLCIEILGYHMIDSAKAETISNTLNAGYPSHSYPITLREASRIGLNVEPLPGAVNRTLLELNAIYSEMGQRAMTDFDDRNAHEQHPDDYRGPRTAGFLPAGKGLALSDGRAPLDHAERPQFMAQGGAGRGDGCGVGLSDPVAAALAGGLP